MSHLGRCFIDGFYSIEDIHVLRFSKSVIRIHDTGLKRMEVMQDIIRECHIHTCFIVLELRAPCSTSHTSFDWKTKIKCHIRNGEILIIEMTEMFNLNSSGVDASKCSIDVSVTEDDHARFEHALDLCNESFHQIGSMYHVEDSCWQFQIFAF